MWSKSLCVSDSVLGPVGRRLEGVARPPPHVVCSGCTVCLLEAVLTESGRGPGFPEFGSVLGCSVTVFSQHSIIL